MRLAYDDVIARLLVYLEERNFGVKSTESRISERFRTKAPFHPDIIARAEKSIDLFSKSRQAAGPNRFNKANVLSWLLFFSRFVDLSGVDPDFMGLFLSPGAKSMADHHISFAIEVFDDRSSLRVTDVSSVIYRDVSLFYVYYFLKFSLPQGVPESVILEIRDQLAGQGDIVSFELALEQSIDVESWSSTL